VASTYAALRLRLTEMKSCDESRDIGEDLGRVSLSRMAGPKHTLSAGSIAQLLDIVSTVYEAASRLQRGPARSSCEPRKPVEAVPQLRRGEINTSHIGVGDLSMSRMLCRAVAAHSTVARPAIGW